MDIRMIMKTGRSVSLELSDGGIYHTKSTYDILVNGEKWQETDTVITSVYGLMPDSRYEIEIMESIEKYFPLIYNKIDLNQSNFFL